MYHVVIDLEMNPVSREFREIRRKMNDEIIEIGAVKLDENFAQISEFQCYVKPQYGSIRKNIVTLTGITDEKVADKENFAPAFMKFVEWIGNNDEDVTVYSWSMSDLKQIKSECRVKLTDFDTAALAARWVDLQKEFDDRLGLSSSLALKHALGAMDHRFEGKQHTALADAINTGAILILMQDEEKFRRTMQPVIELFQHQEELSASIGDLCPELMELQKEL